VKEKTILEIFAETAEKNRAEVAAMEKEMAGNCREEQKNLERIRADLARERALHSKLRAEYDGLEAGIEAEVRAGLEQTEITWQKVSRDTASLDDFLKAGAMGESKFREKARAGGSEKLTGALSLIRAKEARVYELEAAEAEAVYEIAYCTTAAPQLRLAKLKEETESFQRSLNPVVEALMAAQNANEKAKNNLLHSQGKHVFNILWDRITVPEIRELRFDGRIRENLIPQIETFLAKADSGAIYRGIYVAMADETGPPLTYLLQKSGGYKMTQRTFTASEIARLLSSQAGAERKGRADR